MARLARRYCLVSRTRVPATRAAHTQPQPTGVVVHPVRAKDDADAPMPVQLSYGSWLRQSTAGGRSVSRQERQAAILAISAAQEDVPALSMPAQSRPNQLRALPTAEVQIPNDGISYGRACVAGTTLSKAQRVAHVQKFLDSTRDTDVDKLIASMVEAVSKDTRAPVLPPPATEPVLPMSRSGYNWSELAGRNVFSYGKFCATNRNATPDARRTAAQNFLNASAL
jgi:hypothetical protein